MLRSTSICASFLYNYLLSDSQYKDKDGNVLDKKCQKLRCLSDTLQSYGGVLSKLSQMLSLNDETSNVFSDCKPFSKKKTISYFKKYVNENNKLKSMIEYIDFNVFKSGSVGQVHRGVYKEDDIIFKVQYVGLAEQTIKDLKLLDKITSYLYHFTDMKKAMIDIKTKMNEELNYNLEINNQLLMEKIYKDNDEIYIPSIIPELCNDKIIAMKYVEGRTLKKFIEESKQDERDVIGRYIVKFIFENLYKRGIFYSDIHYGNFLVKEDMTLCVLDFGCIHKISKELVQNMRLLHRSIKEEDKEAFYILVENIGIIDSSNISEESKKYIYDYFRLQYEPWVSESFEFTEEWLLKSVEKNSELMKEWNLPQEMVYFNKIPYGSYHLFTKLKLKGNFSKIFENIFQNINE